MSTPGVEPGLSRPQRDVLTTRRCGLGVGLVELGLARLSRSARLRRLGRGHAGWQERDDQSSPFIFQSAPAQECEQTLHMAAWAMKSEGREIRTPNLLIWSQTRCRCAIPPLQGSSGIYVWTMHHRRGTRRQRSFARVSDGESAQSAK